MSSLKFSGSVQLVYKYNLQHNKLSVKYDCNCLCYTARLCSCYVSSVESHTEFQTVNCFTLRAIIMRIWT
jgi:hypothetical protein